MDELKTFFLNKKNSATLLGLLLMVVILPLGIALIRQQQIYFSQASGEMIKIGTGRCVTEKDGKKVLTCNEVPIDITAFFDPNATSAANLNNSDNKAQLSELVSKVNEIVVPEAEAYDKNRCEGDQTPGVGGLIDIAVNGCGEILNYSQIQNSCLPAASVQYKAPVWNATKNEWETIKQDGTVISQAEMIQRSQNDGRFEIDLSSTSNPPWINCEVYFEYSGRNDCDVAPQKNAAGQNMGREGTELDSGQIFTMDVAKAANPNHQNQPDCKQQVQVELAAAAPTTTPTPTATPSPTPVATNQCTAGTYSAALMEIPNGCGTITSQPAAGATAGVITYTAPNVTSDVVCNLKVNTSNNGDCKLDSGGKGTSASTALKPNESLNINFSNVCTDNTAGCNLPIVISSAAAIPTDKAAYKLAESESGLSAATERGFQTRNFTATYTLADTKPGLKTIYVEIINKQTGEKKTDFTTIELLDQNPLIKQVGCAFNIEKNSVDFDLQGLRFGTNGTKVLANGTELEINQLREDSIKASLKNAQINNGEQNYKVKITRNDQTSSEEIQCTVGLSQISLGAKLICRGVGKFSLSNVKLIVIDDRGNRVEETTNISNDGIISGLKTRFENNRNYTVSIDAPNVLRRNITFKAKEGTTVITKDDGTTLTLPVGDIYPTGSGGDGTINTLDQAELQRQWRTVESTATATLTADFNQDKRVNSFDWSCMRKDFGASDDPLPSSPSATTTTVDFTNPTENGTGKTTVIFGTPSSSGSNPANIPSGSNTPRIFIQAPAN